MSFLNPGLLWAFALAAIPIIIHLMNRLRHRTVRWAAMEMLLRAAQKSRNARKIRNWIILAMRALAVAALAAVVVRPLLGGGWLGVFGSSKLDAVIILFDRSPSMECIDPISGQTLREKAIKQLEETLGQHRKSSRVIVLDSATGLPITLSSPTQLSKIPQTDPSQAIADIPFLLAQAAKLIEKESLSSTEIWIASDLQQSNWRPEDSSWESTITQLTELPNPPSIRLLTNSAGKIEDSTLELTQAVRQGDNLVVEYSLQHLGKELPSQLLVHVDGKRYEEAIPPFQNELRSTLTIPLDPESTQGWAEIALPADAIPSNSKIYAVYGSAVTQKSVVFANETTSAVTTKIALAPPGFDHLQSSISNNFATLDLENIGLLVWQGAPPTTEAANKKLIEYLDAGGHLLLLPPEDPNGETNEFLGMQWGEIQNADVDDFFTVKPSLYNTGILLPFQDGREIQFSQTQVIRRQLPVVKNAEVLAKFTDDSPFLLRFPVGSRGVVHVLSTLPEHTWSSLSDQIELPVILHRLLNEGSNRLSEQTISTVGNSLAPATAPARWQHLQTKTMQWQGVHEEVTTHAGVYKAGQQIAAFNVPSQELIATNIPESDLDLLFENLDLVVFSQAAGESKNLTREAWRLAAAALLLFLLVEAALCLPAKPKPSADPFQLNSTNYS